MWLFCKCGFFSAVEHRDKKDTILLRARFNGDLERLVDFINENKLGEVNSSDIISSPNADYAFRMEITKELWAKTTGLIASQVDYDNFKNSVHEGHGSPRDEAYMGCWWELRKGQMHK